MSKEAKFIVKIMAIILIAIVMVGCATTKTVINVEYACPTQYGNGKIAVAILDR